MMPDNATQIQGMSRFMLNARMISIMPEATSEAPSASVSSTAANSGFSNVTKTGDDVEHTEQSPEQAFAQALDFKGVNDLGNPGNNHCEANDKHARHRRYQDASQRNEPRK